MQIVTIHESGSGADKMRVESWGNGWAYAIHFGEGDGPFRTKWFQDDDAAQLREEVETIETAQPEILTRDAWLLALDPHL